MIRGVFDVADIGLAYSFIGGDADDDASRLAILEKSVTRLKLAAVFTNC